MRRGCARLGHGVLTLRTAVSRVLRTLWWWPHLRRVQHDGVRRSMSRRRALTPVLDTPPMPTAPLTAAAAYELHLVCYFADYLSAMWALKSYLQYADQHVHLYLHVQGHAPWWMRRRLRRHFPDARLVLQDEADRIVIPWLAARQYTRLAQLRASAAVMLKLVDVALIGRLNRVLLLDSDVLFFKAPTELLAAAGDPTATTFQQDAFSCYVLSREQARSAFQIELVERVNTGIVAIDRSAIDLGLCERLVEHPTFWDRRSGWGEQTLYALLASARGPVQLLPSTYAISMDEPPRPDSLVARHYSGPSRQYLTAHGIPFLRNRRSALEATTRA